MGYDTTPTSGPYRRGLVMGLTLAELMLLVLFALLLILGWSIQRSQEDQQVVAAIKRNMERAGYSPNVQDLPETFRVLVEDRGIVQAVREAMQSEGMSASAPGEARPTPEQAAKRALSWLRLGSATERALGPNRVGQPNSEAAQEFVTLAAQKFGQGSTTGGFGSSRLWLGESLARAEKCPGRGGSGYPSCAVAQDGTTELVFEVFLGVSTIRVHDRGSSFVAGRASELGVPGIRFDEDVPWQEFLRMTRPMFDWSTDKQCRFWVRVTDETPATEKMTYKVQRRRVENHYYVDEPLVGNAGGGR